MKKEEFLAKIVDILQTEEKITFETVLNDLEDWDSITTVAIVTWFSDEGISLSLKELSSFTTVGQIAEKFGIL